jgi:hypothetical protein
MVEFKFIKVKINEILSKKSQFFGISIMDFQPKLWPIGQKSQKNKYSLVPYCHQNNFELSDMTQNFCGRA